MQRRATINYIIRKSEYIKSCVIRSFMTNFIVTSSLQIN